MSLHLINKLYFGASLPPAESLLRKGKHELLNTHGVGRSIHRLAFHRANIAAVAGWLRLAEVVRHPAVDLYAHVYTLGDLVLAP